MLFRSPRILSLACVLASWLPLAAADNSHVIAPGPDGARWRIEALDPGIFRLWLKPAGDFTRPPSIAMEAAPTVRLQTSVSVSDEVTTVRTEAMSLFINRRALQFEAQSGGMTLIPKTTIHFSTNTPSWTLTQFLPEGERLLGLGQDNHNQGRLDRRGVIRELWAGQQINSGNVTAQYPVPLLIGLLADGRAFGIFFDNTHRLTFDLGTTRPEELRLDAAGGEIDLYLLAGPRIADVIERYTRLTGRPSLPPLWTLGYWQSKCTYYDWRALDETYQQLHSRGFPVDVLVIDYDWPEVLNNYKWAKRWFTDGKTPAERIADYARRGVRIVTSQSGPMIKRESPTFQSGWDQGVFATDGQGHPVQAGYYGGELLDFTHPRLNDWLWPQVRERLRDGIAGWWLDLTEPEGEPPQAHYYGGRPDEVHNEFSLRCTLSYEGAQLAEYPDRRPWILTRSASAGSQAHHAAVWTGDIYSDYATLRAHPPEMLNSGLSGLTWWTCDSGGFLEGYYRQDQMGAHARLYERWMQFSVFAPITRAHKAGGLPEPYQFGPAVEQSCLHYLKLRYRLLPYIYSCAWEASQTGLPIVRPLALDFQQDLRSVSCPGNEYLFGPALLVAPALFEGQVNRSVYFPPGKWIDWDYGCEYQGGREYVVAAPPNRIPVAVRAGAILPLAPEMLSTGEKSWDPLTLEVFPAGHSQFTLYRDDGATFAYRRGEYTKTIIDCDASNSTVVLEIRESNKKFTPATYETRFHLNARPAAITDIDGAPLNHQWSDQTHVLSVSLKAGSATNHLIHVALEDHPFPPASPPAIHLDPIDANGEATGSGGKPMPQFYPPPPLPARVKAVNYDKGGEGVAFHSARMLPSTPIYRPDDFSIQTSAACGDFVLGGLSAGEWVCYTVDPGNGGWFDLTARVAGGGQLRLMALDQIVADINVPNTGSPDVWQSVIAHRIYLNPGPITLQLLVKQPGLRLSFIEFARPTGAPRFYPACRAARTGVAEIDPSGGPDGTGAVRNLGRIGTGLTWGVLSPQAGSASLRFRYQSFNDHPLPFSVQVGNTPVHLIQLPPTRDTWQEFNVPVNLESGGNRVQLKGLVDGWSSISLDRLELVIP